MKFAVVFTLLCATACGPTWNVEEYTGDPTENALAAFAAVHEAPSVYCAQRARDLEIDIVPIGDVRRECAHESAVGCMYRYDSVRASAYIAEGQGPDVIAHETMHALLHCELPFDVDGNHNHRDAVWRDKRINP